MIRTQISLGKYEYERAKKAAHEQGISLAEFFRRSLHKDLPVDKNKPWMHFCGFISSGDHHSSQNIDDIVYGNKD